MTGTSGPQDVVFWRRHAMVGLLSSWLAIGIALPYVRRSAADPDRPVLTTVAVVGFVLSLAFWALIRACATTRVVLPLFWLWSAASTAVILLALEIDGGNTSPLRPLLFVVLMYAALAYPWRLVLALGVLELCGAAYVLRLGEPAGTAQKDFLFVSLCLTVAMVTVAAHNRGTQATRLKELTRRLAEQATHDELTQCLNRRGFDLALEHEVGRSQRYGRPLSLLALDIDHLKEINDTGGHAAGDEAIKAVATAMRSVARETDIFGRPGGDEFALLLPETDVDEAFALASRLRDRLRRDAGTTPVTVSIGLASTAHAAATTSAELSRAADLALYAAKAAGRDRIEPCRAGSAVTTG